MAQPGRTVRGRRSRPARAAGLTVCRPRHRAVSILRFPGPSSSSLSRVTTTGDDPGVGGAAREGVSDRVEEAAAPEMVLEEQRDASVHSSQAKIEIVSYSM